MGADCATLARQGRRSWAISGRQSALFGGSALDRPSWRSLARSAGDVWELELGFPALSAMGSKRRLRTALPSALRRARFRICAHRRHDRQSPLARNRGKRGTHNQAVGKSRGGLTTKIVALVDALGNLARFVLLPGQRHDSVGVEPLITGIDLAALIADKTFDSNALRAKLHERGALAVIPSKADRKAPIPHDAEMYKWRHLIENCFQRLKEFRRIATRYDKTDTSFAAFIHLRAAWLALK